MTSDKIRKIKALMNDSASTPNEKLICKNLIASIEDDTGEESEHWREDLYKEMEHIWITRVGERIKIRDMKSGHLINTILYIKRHISEEIVRDIPIYLNMIKEAEKRKIAGALHYGEKRATNYIT